MLNPSLTNLPSSPLPRLLLGHARQGARHRHRLGWLLDERLADLVRGARDPMIAAIRMAWWRDALVQDDRSKGRGEPLVEALRALPPTSKDRAAIDRMIEGWSLLLDDEPLDAPALRAFGTGRGGGLFAFLAGPAWADQAEAVGRAGSLWALWDLAGHVSDPDLARAAIVEAAGWSRGPDIIPSGRALKPMRLAMRVALSDVRAQRVPPRGFAPRHYARLLLHGLFD